MGRPHRMPFGKAEVVGFEEKAATHSEKEERNMPGPHLLKARVT